MANLKHPAEESAERLSNGEVDNAMLDRRTRAELKFIANEVAPGLNWNDDALATEVFEGEGSATVSGQELVELVRYVARVEASGE